jgi:hypothetical protein
VPSRDISTNMHKNVEMFPRRSHKMRCLEASKWLEAFCVEKKVAFWARDRQNEVMCEALGSMLRARLLLRHVETMRRGRRNKKISAETRSVGIDK